MSENKFVAKRMYRLPEYPIQQIFIRAKEIEQSGGEVIHLELGEPDFDTPRFIVDAAHKAMEKGYTRYTSSMGMIELREAIAEKLLVDRGVEVNPEREIIILPGSKHALYCSLVATLNPGEEIIISDPCFPPYEFAINLVEGKPVRLPLREDLDFKLESEELENRITSKTKMVLLNFPNNPTGSVLTNESLETISEIAQEHDLLVISDDVYEKFVYNEVKFHSILSFPGMQERTILINSFSKTYSMTGWRLGYAVAPEGIIEKICKVQQSTTTCAPPFCQIAAMEALKRGDEFIKRVVSEFSRRRKRLVRGLNKIEEISCRMPKGAFYAFPNITDLGISSGEFSEYLLETGGVATVPGSAFGRCGEGYLRISYANSMEKIGKALKRIGDTIEKVRA